MKKRLFFFTAEFPYGNHETFIQNEAPFTSGFYDEVMVCPYKGTGPKRELPPNFEVCETVNLKSRGILFLHARTVIKILFVEFKTSKNRWFFIKNIRRWLSLIKSALERSAAIEKTLGEYTGGVHHYYSFWMDDWALVLAILKYKKKINRFFFRCGGFDIWNERHPGNYLPFRYFIYSQTNGVYPNSKQGERYLKQLGFFTEKIQCRYWGTPDRGENIPPDNNEKILVSCSSLIPLKRVELLAKALCECKTAVKWVHFGDGPCQGDIIGIMKNAPDNIQYQLMGNVPNQTVHRYYQQNPVDFFVTTSETESLPVSIQEAMSYGIPVIATNVGGISEMIDDQSGVLIEKNFQVGSLTDLIDNISPVRWRNSEVRSGIKRQWKEKFEDKNVYTGFYKDLAKLT